MQPTRLEPTATRPQAHFSLWDTVCIIVGIIIGTGIFKTPGAVFALFDNAYQALGVWILGGLLCLVGSFCFAELASTYPRSGGDYVYLTRAFGNWAGFLFAWGQLLIVRTAASIVPFAYVFAEYALTLLQIGKQSAYYTLLYTLLALGSIACLTLVNIVGVRFGKWTQNGLTVIKVLGLTAVLTTGFILGLSGDPADGKVEQIQATLEAPAVHTAWEALALALIMILWTYAGWHEGAYVAAEVDNPRRNLPRALLLGIAVVIVLYVLVNAAYICGLGYERAAGSETVAADLLDQLPGHVGVSAISVLVMLSALGAINGMLCTNSRIFAEFGNDHPVFAPLGRWSPHFGTPMIALLVQMAICALTIVVIACIIGSFQTFQTLINGTAPVFWFFFLGAGVSVFVLRWKDGAIERPFKTPLYPLTPLLFCGSCLLMVIGSAVASPADAAAWAGILLLGVPFYWLSRPKTRAAPAPQSSPPTPQVFTRG